MPDRSAFAKPCDRRSELRLAVLEAWVSANAVRQALPRLHLELTPSPGTPVCSANKTRWCD